MGEDDVPIRLSGGFVAAGLQVSLADPIHGLRTALTGGVIGDELFKVRAQGIWLLGNLEGMTDAKHAFLIKLGVERAVDGAVRGDGLVDVADGS